MYLHKIFGFIRNKNGLEKENDAPVGGFGISHAHLFH
jgi:hypothetical protein